VTRKGREAGEDDADTREEREAGELGGMPEQAGKAISGKREEGEEFTQRSLRKSTEVAEESRIGDKIQRLRSFGPQQARPSGRPGFVCIATQII